MLPGVISTLEKLSLKYTLCVASNAGESDILLMKKALERGSIEKYFKYFFISKDLGFEKPDYRFFHEILKKIHCHPSECAMVGNDYEKDIVASKILGMKTIYFDEKNISSENKFEDYKIYQMKELLDIFKI